MMDRVGEVFVKGLVKVFGSHNDRSLKDTLPVVEKINSLEGGLRELSDKQLKEKTNEFKDRLGKGETLDKILPEAFAVVRETSRRVLGMRHFDVQMIGGMVLHQGKIAEMTTGEGKTLVSTCPAYLNALQGHVAVVTVNDYLAQRDCDWMRPIFEFLGLTVGCIQSEMFPQERLRQYRCDITYGTNNEYGFDYLRDNMKMSREEQCQRVLNYAIIDEVDSVLIDEARTPLIIAGPAEESTDRYYTACGLVKKLKEGVHFELKEKEQLALLTEEGIEYAEKLIGVDSFYKGKNMVWPHHISQALRAQEFFKNDKEYMVKEGQIVIIDEHTGRPQPGRRWSDGLHQAIEAKEKLKIREENQTLASITFQNYFRLFNKLSGMTGTAVTEAGEFDKIYNLDVLCVPTNRPLKRLSHDDAIYGTDSEKYQAIAQEITLYHRCGRPVLVGTITVEKSELISKILTAREIPHQVLNAKYHEKEAGVVAKAGHLGAVTVATNMAGRGTDIKLGTFTKKQLLDHWKENRLAPKKLSLDDSQFEEKLYQHWAKVFLKDQPMKKSLEELSLDEIKSKLEDYWEEVQMSPVQLCESVQSLGGLHVLGTERHDSRRIDNQLRGRCGRQGDPGSSRFFLSFEDDLLRKFAPPAMIKLMQGMGMQEGQDIRHPMLNRGIGKAQKRVEGYNFDIRKSLLEYDEVMNEQRKLIYDNRQSVLNRKELRKTVTRMIEDRIDVALDIYLPDRAENEWDYSGLCDWLASKFLIHKKPQELEGKNYKEVQEILLDATKKEYDKREKEMSSEAMRELESYLLLSNIDSKWKDHLYAMDVLKSGINLVAMGQKDPKIEYKREGYHLFDELLSAIQEEVTDCIFKLTIEKSDLDLLNEIWNPQNFSHDQAHQAPIGNVPPEVQAQMAAQAQQVPKTIKRDLPKVGRNDPCSCGSGKKFKKCCGR